MALCRLPSELPGVTLSVKSSGPLLPLDRTAAGWELPRMAPHDRAAATIKVRYRIGHALACPGALPPS